MTTTKNTPDAEYNPDVKAYVVPGKPATAESLVVFLTRSAKARKITPYRVGRFTGLTMGAVNHFFAGYKGEPSREAKDPLTVGKVRLDTFLRIVHSLGFDIELVVRETPGQGKL